MMRMEFHPGSIERQTGIGPECAWCGKPINEGEQYERDNGGEFFHAPDCHMDAWYDATGGEREATW
jgi:hypothetical protein